MPKKSKAQIERMKRRAAARGEEYIPPEQPEEEKLPKEEKEDSKRLEIARNLQKELAVIDKNEELKSKERRSAKRKAEAIAAEEAGCDAKELLEWYETQGDVGAPEKEEKTKGDDKKSSKSGRNPYIVFVGQLSYNTTKEGLFNHIKNELGDEHEVTPDTIQIRLLTDKKTKKSRGMAFCETTDPELLYALLKLHHTQLDGRRLNVERSAGGKGESKKTKLSQLRKEQDEYMSETVDKMLADYLTAGELEEKELDDGVIALCKRHSAAVVEAALQEYMETQGRDKDNPSAYLTFIIGRIATEGIDNHRKEKLEKEKRGGKGQNRGERKRSRPSSSGTETEHGVVGSKLRKGSQLMNAGVDMRTSDATDSRDMTKIFPSMSRGRGRGRGYM